MKKGRYQHQADMLCHMFRGWQLFPDYQILAKLGSGTLIINLIQKSCTHNGQEVRKLSIASVLRSFLEDDLNQNGASIEQLSEASLRVDYTLDVHDGQEDKATSWGKPEKFYVGCQLTAISQISITDKVFTSRLTDKIEWPKNFKAV